MGDGLADLSMNELERIRNLNKGQFSNMFTPVTIFDSTMRDGEASARIHFSPEAKVRMAIAMEAAGVRAIEAGIPGVSQNDVAAVRAVASAVKDAEVVALTGASKHQVEAAMRALESAQRPVVNIYAPVSDELIARRRGRTRVQMVRRIREMVAMAAGHFSAVQFSCMDAGRAERPFLRQVVQDAVDAGATRVGIADSVGGETPPTFIPMVRDIVGLIGDRVTVSAHCHGEGAKAIENAVSAIYAGARQVEVALNIPGASNPNADTVGTVAAIESRWPGRSGVDVVAMQRVRTIVESAVSDESVVATQVPCAMVS